MRRPAAYWYYLMGTGFHRLRVRLTAYLRAYRHSLLRNTHRTRTSVYWAIWYASGILVAEFLHLDLPAAVCALAAVLVTVGALHHFNGRYKCRWLLLLSVGIVVCVLGTPPLPKTAWLGPVSIRGVIARIYSSEKHRIQAVVRLEEVKVANPSEVVCYRLPKRRFLQKPWLALVTIYLPASEEQKADASSLGGEGEWNVLVPGRVLEFDGTLRLPKDSGNHGLFDYCAYLRRHGITSTVAVQWEDLRIGPLAGFGISRFIYQMGRYLTDQMRFLLPERYGIVQGLILGDTSQISPSDEGAFRKAGISHILSVSGLHVGLVYLLIGRVIKRLRLGRLWEIGLTAVGLGGFVLLAGGKVPAVRAALGLLGGLLFQGSERKVDAVSLAIVSSMVILTLSPLSLFDVGFQLSYLAVLGILILTPRLQWILPRNRLGSGIAVSLAASLATMPVCAYYFFVVSVVGGVANLLVVPLVSVIIPLAIVGLFMRVLVPPIAVVVAYPLDWLVRLLITIARTFASLPGSEVVTGQPRPILIILYYMGLFLAIRKLDFLPYLSSKGRVRIWSQLALLVLVWSVWTPVLAAGVPDFCLTVVDVGQGDCIFVRDGQGLEMLIDGGGTDLRYSSFDVGERITLPFLQRLGLNRVDVVVNSHPHFDHLSGLIPVLERMAPQVTVDNGRISPSTARHRWQSLVSNSLHHLAFGEAKEVQIENRRTKVQIIQPLRSQGSGLNDSSLVTKVVWGQWSFLLTGDLEAEGIRALLSGGYDLAADILQIPHHGGENRYLGSLIDAVHPKLAFISVGDNSFGHPAASTLAVLERKGVPVLRTDREGAISFAVLARPGWCKVLDKHGVPPLVVTTDRGGTTVVLEKCEQGRKGGLNGEGSCDNDRRK